MYQKLRVRIVTAALLAALLLIRSDGTNYPSPCRRVCRL